MVRRLLGQHLHYREPFGLPRWLTFACRLVEPQYDFL